MKKIITMIKKEGKKVAALGLAFSMIVGLLSHAAPVLAIADEKTEEAPVIRLGKVEVYSARMDETIIEVPIYTEGAVDFQCYDMTFTFDSDMLEVQKEKSKTGLTALQGYHPVVTSTKGQIRMAGVVTNVDEVTEGQIGKLTFILRGRVRTDGVTTMVGLDVNELGFETEAKNVTAGQGVIVLNKSKAPEETSAPESYFYGDVNKNGEVAASDALAILKYVVKLPTSSDEFDTTDEVAMALADMTGDGEIRAEDALQVLKVVVKLVEKTSYVDVEKDPIVTKAPAEATEQPEATPVPTELPGETTEPSDWSTPVTIQTGDLTADGAYSVRDALYAWQIAEGIKEVDDTVKATADVNGDGTVTEKDRNLLVDAALGEYTSFGYEKPSEDHVIYVDCKTLTKGDYCYRTLGEAVNYLNKNQPADEAERVTVRIAPGTYREHTVLNAPYVTYEAMYSEKEMPNITFYYGCGMKYYSINNGGSSAGAETASTVINSGAHDFIAKNLMFENSYNIYVTEEERSDYSTENFPTLDRREDSIRDSNYQTQGLALRIDADRAQVYNCRIIGRQDTLLMNNQNRCYYEDCYIEGTVDFIYGSGIAVFESCTVNSPYHNGHITAASTPIEQPFGFLFKDCVFTKDAVTEDPAPKEESYSLGRPWNGPAMVVYYNCRMDNHISTKHTEEDRFVTMREEHPKEEARFGECGTMDINGNPYDLTDICPDYEKILTEEDMSTTYAPYLWLSQKFNRQTNQLEHDGWNPGGYTVVDVQ